MRTMQLHASTALLAGLSPAAFMRRHWQRKPLLVRAAWPGVVPPLQRAALFALAAQPGVESRLVEREGRAYTLARGPLPRRSLPPVRRPGWTLLVQGLDLHVAAARTMLERFRFLPDARLDDLMVSWASDGGGVGAHLDAYDVFLLQVQGVRRWRWGAVRSAQEAEFQRGQPLKLLRRFRPSHEALLEPGDLLYLPPGWAHEGTAVGGECMTCSIGFRAATATETARELLLRVADAQDGEPGAEGDGESPRLRRYGDGGEPATATPAAVPERLQRFARQALERALREPQALERALGEWLSEPKPDVWFAPAGKAARGALRLVARSRMLYDRHHLFLNGESYRVAGADARLLRAMADTRVLTAAARARLSTEAAAAVDEWLAAGWLEGDES